MPNSANGKHKINFLDFLLIVLIIAIISAAIVSVIRSNPNRISGGDTKRTFKIKCEMVDKSVSENISANDSVYDNNTNQLLGTVVAIENTPVDAIDVTQLGAPTVTTDKVTLTLTISSTAWKDNGLYSIDSFRIAAGQSIDFHSEQVSLSGICVSLTAQ